MADLHHRHIHLNRCIIGFVTVLALSSLTILATGTPARADGSRDEVLAYMAAHPGGERIGDSDISYGGGVFIVTVVQTRALAGPDCPSGWYCFYDGVNYTYPRGRLSDCGFQRLSTWSWQNRVESAHYNLATGSVVFIDETGSTDTTLFTIGVSRRTVADVGSARNRADYVFRYC
jgi:hypothetical protein